MTAPIPSSPPPSDIESPPPPAPPLHKLADHLSRSLESGFLGKSPPEPSSIPTLRVFFSTFPLLLLIPQLLWSLLVVLLSYHVSDAPGSTLSTAFWQTDLNLAPSVVFGVGWALFVLLGLSIRDATSRYREALEAWGKIPTVLKMHVRMIVHYMPRGVWHEGDRERLLAHLIAFPIALKMVLRGERDPEQLAGILGDDDVKDVLAERRMDLRCIKVIRGYYSCLAEGTDVGFKPTLKKKLPFIRMQLEDALERLGNKLVRIKDFQVAKGYGFHVEVFLIIWLAFLPFAIVGNAGWFTMLWTGLITYGVGMLARIARNLNDPFGFDLEDIRLNQLCVEAALEVVETVGKDKLEIDDLVRESEPPTWTMEKVAQRQQKKKSKRVPLLGWLVKYIRTMKFRKDVAGPLLVFVMWLSAVVVGSWALAEFVVDREGLEGSGRWWDLYVPLSSGTTAYIGLGIFLILGFWVNDAYGRYKKGLYLWKVVIQPTLESLATSVCIMYREGSWHRGDKERIVSHLMAFPFAAKLHLRDDRNVDELKDILSAVDLALLQESRNYPDHCLNVVQAYLDAVEGGHESFKPQKNPVFCSKLRSDEAVVELAKAVEECEVMRRFPIPHAFTFHLRIYAGLWLLVLPLSFVDFHGWLSFPFLIAVAYSVLNLLAVGNELVDPFGTDKYDAPLDQFCFEAKAELHRIYSALSSGCSSVVKQTSYSRAAFMPQPRDAEDAKKGKHSQVRQLLAQIANAFPSVNIYAQVGITLWTVGIVFASYGLSKTWPDQDSLDCGAWCSPIDVSGDLLLELGFALFLILSFRASEAVDRYSEGANLLSALKGGLRHLVMDVFKHLPDGVYHESDKERLAAHLIQLPLALRDELLLETDDTNIVDGVLSGEDRLDLRNAGNSLGYIHGVMQCYLETIDSYDLAYRNMQTSHQHLDFGIRYSFSSRSLSLRKVTANIQLMKQFPVVSSYTRHQRMFTALWLFLLPLSMTSSSGFWTILWAPVISYGILGLEAIATELMDPFGTDSVDLPVRGMCQNGATAVVAAANSIKWNCYYHLLPSKVDNGPGTGLIISNSKILQNFSLPHVSEDSTADKYTGLSVPKFRTPFKRMRNHTILNHLQHSVPWWGLLALASWTTLATMISYLVGDMAETKRWWTSEIRVAGEVGSYVSFGAFMLLGFYVQAAFNRYHIAGEAWGDDLRAACHSLAAQILSYAPPGTCHDGDMTRIIAHIASIPIALKMELRKDRNIGELRGLLSQQDVGRVHCAGNMAQHCLDVVRSYYAVMTSQPHRLQRDFKFLCRTVTIPTDIMKLEGVIRRCLLIRDVDISRGFMILLRVLIAILFFLLPFILAESSGWFTILWVTLIGYGVIGVYSVANELQNPFGTDVNDLDLDGMALEIVNDVLFVERNYRGGSSALIFDVTSPVPTSASKSRFSQNSHIAEKATALKVWTKQFAVARDWLRLFTSAVTWWTLPIVAVWATGATALAYLISREFPISAECPQGFCSRIAVNGDVKKYVGFALFLLLGFRLYDSHWRYVEALTAWRDGIKGISGILSNRLFASLKNGMFHPRDLDRVAAHLTAFAFVTVSKLRRFQINREVLTTFMHPDDVARIEHAPEAGDYCLDVVRAYLSKADEMICDGAKISLGVEEGIQQFFYVTSLRDQASFCERILRIPLPFGYVQHTRVFLVIWILLLPLGLVEEQGWYAILWTVIVAYGLAGVEKWSTELSDPFGLDISDIPLPELCADVAETIRSNLITFKPRGVASVVIPDRDSLQIETKSS